jgi:hypothetical protein
MELIVIYEVQNCSGMVHCRVLFCGCMCVSDLSYMNGFMWFQKSNELNYTYFARICTDQIQYPGLVFN